MCGQRQECVNEINSSVTVCVYGWGIPHTIVAATRVAGVWLRYWGCCLRVWGTGTPHKRMIKGTCTQCQGTCERMQRKWYFDPCIGCVHDSLLDGARTASQLERETKHKRNSANFNKIKILFIPSKTIFCGVYL